MFNKRIALELPIYPDKDLIYIPLHLGKKDRDNNCVYEISLDNDYNYLIEYLRVREKLLSASDKENRNVSSNPMTAAETGQAKLIFTPYCKVNKLSNTDNKNLTINMVIFDSEIARIEDPNQWNLLKTYMINEENYFSKFLHKHTKEFMSLNNLCLLHKDKYLLPKINLEQKFQLVKEITIGNRWKNLGTFFMMMCFVQLMILLNLTTDQENICGLGEMLINDEKQFDLMQKRDQLSFTPHNNITLSIPQLKIMDKSFFDTKTEQEYSSKKFIQNFDSLMDNEFKYEESFDMKDFDQKNKHGNIFLDYYTENCFPGSSGKDFFTYNKILNSINTYLTQHNNRIQHFYDEVKSQTATYTETYKNHLLIHKDLLEKVTETKKRIALDIQLLENTPINESERLDGPYLKKRQDVLSSIEK